MTHQEEVGGAHPVPVHVTHRQARGGFLSLLGNEGEGEGEGEKGDCVGEGDGQSGMGAWVIYMHASIIYYTSSRDITPQLNPHVSHLV